MSTTRSNHRPSWHLKRAMVCIAGLLMFTSTLLHGAPASASCLGLKVPPPADLNVCRVLAKDLLVPQFSTVCKPMSSWQCLLTPHCCAPTCALHPECKVVAELAPLLVNAGDVYCGVQEISAEDMVDDFVNQRYTDFTTLVTGGANSAVYKMIGAHVDSLECLADPLPGALKDVLKKFAALPGAPNTMFAALDVDNIRILRASTATARMYLQGPVLNGDEEASAVTLGTLVIMQNRFFDTMRAWNRTWNDTQWGSLTNAQLESLSLVAHELVHVRQYREIGRERLFNQYVPEILAPGDALVSFEEEAFAIGGGALLDRRPWLHGRYWAGVGVTTAQALSVLFR